MKLKNTLKAIFVFILVSIIIALIVIIFSDKDNSIIDNQSIGVIK